MNVSNTWNITSRHKNLMLPCNKCDSEEHIAPKIPLPCNLDHIKRAKEALEASFGSGSCCDKGGQLKNYCGKWKRDKDKYNGGDNKGNHNNFVNSVQNRGME